MSASVQQMQAASIADDVSMTVGRATSVSTGWSPMTFSIGAKRGVWLLLLSHSVAAGSRRQRLPCQEDRPATAVGTVDERFTLINLNKRVPRPRTRRHPPGRRITPATLPTRGMSLATRSQAARSSTLQSTPGSPTASRAAMAAVSTASPSTATFGTSPRLALARRLANPEARL